MLRKKFVPEKYKRTGYRRQKKMLKCFYPIVVLLVSFHKSKVQHFDQTMANALERCGEEKHDEGGDANKTWWPDDCFLLLFHCSTKRSREKNNLLDFAFGKKTAKYFYEQNVLASETCYWRGGNRKYPLYHFASCVFFEGKSYTSAAVNSHLKRAKIGKSQCRKVRGKNTRVTYLYQTAFDQESLDIIVKGEKEIL